VTFVPGKGGSSVSPGHQEQAETQRCMPRTFEWTVIRMGYLTMWFRAAITDLSQVLTVNCGDDSMISRTISEAGLRPRRRRALYIAVNFERKDQLPLNLRAGEIMNCP
jgi:hypothetical protein